MSAKHHRLRQGVAGCVDCGLPMLACGLLTECDPSIDAAGHLEALQADPRPEAALVLEALEEDGYGTVGAV